MCKHLEAVYEVLVQQKVAVRPVALGETGIQLAAELRCAECDEWLAGNLIGYEEQNR